MIVRRSSGERGTGDGRQTNGHGRAHRLDEASAFRGRSSSREACHAAESRRSELDGLRHCADAPRHGTERPILRAAPHCRLPMGRAWEGRKARHGTRVDRSRQQRASAIQHDRIQMWTSLCSSAWRQGSTVVVAPAGPAAWHAGGCLGPPPWHLST
jgi:hypothetical protein